MESKWVNEIHHVCKKQNVPFFFKQWGGVRKDLTGRIFKGKTYDEMPYQLEQKVLELA